MVDIVYKELPPEYYRAVVVLANDVHGDGYLTMDTIEQWVTKGISHKINSSFIALLGGQLIGFRVTYAAQQWPLDQWCSFELWKAPVEKCCYFKCNTVDEKYHGLGIGKKLLKFAIEAATKQGTIAGIYPLPFKMHVSERLSDFNSRHCDDIMVVPL